MPRPGSVWLRIVLALALMGLMVALGCWQLDRAEQKRTLRATFERQLEAPPLDLALHAAEPLTRHPWRAVTAEGHFEPPVFLLDNRVRDGRIGYEVLTAFRLADGTRILVDRGWIQAPPTRTEVPAISIPTAGTRIRGRLAPAPSTGVKVADALRPESLGNDRWRLQHVDFAALEKDFAPGFLPMLVYLDESAPDGYDRAFVLPAVDDGKHTAYAVQWFSMAGAVAILLAISIRRRLRGTPTPDSTEPP